MDQEDTLDFQRVRSDMNVIGFIPLSDLQFLASCSLLGAGLWDIFGLRNQTFFFFSLLFFKATLKL